MKYKLILTLLFGVFFLQVTGQQVLGNFSSAEAFEWPRVIWYRDLASNWDEGIIKTAANTSGIARSGFGIHFNQVRQFTFWSSGFDPLLSIEGGSGKTYIKGNLGIGVLNPYEKLAVNGMIRAKEIKVETENWPDYVFGVGHKIPSLEELEKFVLKNKHLPDLPPAQEVERNGVEIGHLNKILVKKIEEMTLLMIKMNKMIKMQQKKINSMNKQKR